MDEDAQESTRVTFFFGDETEGNRGGGGRRDAGALFYRRALALGKLSPLSCSLPGFRGRFEFLEHSMGEACIRPVRSRLLHAVLLTGRMHTASSLQRDA